MNRRSLFLGMAALATLVCSRDIAHADTDEIVVVVNKANTTRSINRSQLGSIFKVKSTEFPEGGRASPVNLPGDNAQRREFDQVVLGMSPDEVERYWLDSKIRSGVGCPRRLPGPDAVMTFVSGDVRGIGYVARSDVNDSVRVVARVRDGKVVAP
jgi:ABC-type phosphate transport system substrate-binding protein